MPKKYNLTLKGYVGDYSFSSDYVQWFTERNTGRLDVLISSRGGNLFAGVDICDAFRRHGDVHVHYSGFNASAATIASMGAKHVSIDEHAMYLVHKCSSEFFAWRSMNADQLQEYISKLETQKKQMAKIDATMAGLYASRCKKTQASLLALMKEGGWLTAQEALDWGFVDEIVKSSDGEKLKLTAEIRAEFEEHDIPDPTSKIEGIAPEAAAEGADSPETLIKKIKNLFKPKAMNLKCALICAAAGLAELEAKDENVTLSALEALKIEAALSEKTKAAADALEAKAETEKEIAALKAKVAELEAKIAEDGKKPADESPEVVEATKEDKPEPSSPDDFAAFVKAASNAQKLFDSLP